MKLTGLVVACVLACAGARAASLDLTIRPTVGGEPLLVDSVRYHNTAGEAYSVTRLSCLVSGFALEKVEGGWVEVPGQVAWFDAESRRGVTQLENIPAGQYRSIRFYIGLDEQTNRADPGQFRADHPLNPNVNGLHWSWQGGYIFLALEGRFRVGGEPLTGFAYHFARDPNRTRITLPAAFDLPRDTGVEIDFDAGALLNAPRPLSFAKDGVSTHSRPGDPVAVALAVNLPGAFRVRQVSSSLPRYAATEPVKPLYLPAKFTAYQFRLSRQFPLPDLPRDNPLTVERVTLGDRLFHDVRLSRTDTISCATCHDEQHAFADPRRFSVGVNGDVGTRNAMPLINLAWKSRFFWDGRAPSLRAQALMPIQDHTEMDETLTNVVAKLAGVAEYRPLFEAAFGAPEITPEKIGLAIEQFVLTLTSFDSRFDRAMRGEEKLTPVEQRGFELFMTESEPRLGQRGADCFHCHGGALFSNFQFLNNGLPGVTNRFAVPSLRNVALTGPYMHDGRFATLAEVVEHYNSGVERGPTLDPNLAKHPATGLGLSPADRAALVAFLEALTDPSLRVKR